MGDREYAQARRGETREAVLRDFREGLRQLTDPDTHQPFTDDVLRRVTARGSRFYREADATDLILLGVQKRDEFLAQQIRIDRAGSAFLRAYHAVLWGETFLPAFGGSGAVAAHGTPGTVWQGSTLLGDPFAVTGTEGARRYQVLASATADAAGNATLSLVAIDGGDETNPVVGTAITWTNPPPGSDPTGLVTGADFTGGLDAETDAAFAKRLMDRIRHKPASGNWSHLRAFARAASVSVDDAFIYPCAFYAGSELVALTAKRGATLGPLGRVPSLSVLAAVTAMLVPPGSPIVPGRAHVVVVPVVSESTDVVVTLTQPFDSDAGWTDLEPFPDVNGSGAVTITALATQQDFTITASGAGQLPQGAAGPLAGVSLMVWNALTSAFVALVVLTVTDLGAGAYRVVLGAVPGKTLAIGDWISPDMLRRNTLAAGAVAYFDSLGPGEVIDLTTDDRAVRAYRNPQPSEEAPARAGQGVLQYLSDALGAPVSDAALASVSLAQPTLPADPVNGPHLLTLRRFAVYAL
jgi:hypothetical protein